MTPLLSGIKVIDLTTVIMGPFATAQLGAMGADVIKIEAPAGDNVRHIAPMETPAMGTGYLNSNRNKRAVTLDLKTEEGRAALDRIMEGADVLVTNMRRRAARRLGLDRETITERHPNMIHCSAIGFGRNGPYENDAAYDDVVQALSGFASVNADADGAPRFVPQIIVDKLSGLFIVEGVLTALLHRERTGEVRHFELPMMETAAYFLLTEHLQGMTHEPPIGPPGYARLLNPYRKPYRTKDGYIACLPYLDKHWKTMLKLIGREELLSEDWFQTTTERSKRVSELYRMVDEAMPARTTEEWLSALREADIPCGQVNTLETIFEDPHLGAVGFWDGHDHPTQGPLRFPRHPIAWSGDSLPEAPAPEMGQHTVEVLSEAGLDPDEIDGLLKSGAAKAP